MEVIVAGIVSNTQNDPRSNGRNLNGNARIDPRFPGYYVGGTDGDGDFDGAIDADIRSVGGSAK